MTFAQIGMANAIDQEDVKKKFNIWLIPLH